LVVLRAKMKTVRTIAALLFAMSICGCATIDRQSPPLLPGQVGHRESGIVFPETVAEFSRGEVKLYDAAGQDTSAGYNLAAPTNLVAITVYVYPGPRLISIGSPPDVVAAARKHLTDGHFEGVKGEVVKYHPSATAMSDQETGMTFRGRSLYGRTAAFKAEEVFAGRIQPIVTRAEVYAFGKWIIKFRITYPVASEKAAVESTRAFKREFIRENETASSNATRAIR
jgi:hypothetical protein